MKVYVIYDPLYEEVIAVYSTEDAAMKWCKTLNKEREKEYPDTFYWFGYDEFEVLD